MRICVLSDENISDFNPAPFLEGYDWQMVTMTAPVSDRLRSLVDENQYDIFLNICEGSDPAPDGRPGYEAIDVVLALESLNVPFTGADSRCFDPTREEMQSPRQMDWGSQRDTMSKQSKKQRGW